MLSSAAFLVVLHGLVWYVVPGAVVWPGFGDYALFACVLQARTKQLELIRQGTRWVSV